MNRKIIIATILILILSVFAWMAFAEEEGFLTPNGYTDIKVQPGEKVEFSVNLDQLKEYEEDFGSCTLIFEIIAVDEDRTPEDKIFSEDQIYTKDDAPPMYWDVKEKIKIKPNYVKGTYTAEYDDKLKDLSTLNFFARSDNEVKFDDCDSYLYMVDVKVKAKELTEPDSEETEENEVIVLEEAFTFRLIPKEEPTEPTTTTAATKPSKPKHGGFDGGEEEDDKNAYHGSSDNYLRELTVSGQELTQTFHKTRMVYFVDLTEDVSSLDVHAVPCDKGARVDIAGNNNLRDGSGKIVIDVRAVNGDKRTYTIYVRRK